MTENSIMSDRKRKLDVFSGDASGTQNGSALVSPLTGRPYSQRYHDILSKRKGKCAVEST